MHVFDQSTGVMRQEAPGERDGRRFTRCDRCRLRPFPSFATEHVIIRRFWVSTKRPCPGRNAGATITCVFEPPTRKPPSLKAGSEVIIMHVCPNCGTGFHDEEEFCLDCGIKLGKDAHDCTQADRLMRFRPVYKALDEWT